MCVTTIGATPEQIMCEHCSSWAEGSGYPCHMCGAVWPLAGLPCEKCEYIFPVITDMCPRCDALRTKLPERLLTP